MSWSVMLPILIALNLLALLFWLAASPLRLVLVRRRRSIRAERSETAEPQSESYEQLLAAALTERTASTPPATAVRAGGSWCSKTVPPSR